MPRFFSGKVILYILALHVLDLCITPALGIFRPVFLYLWVLYAAFYGPVSALIPAAIIAGVLRDLTGSQPLGVETLSLAGMSCALTFLILKFEHELFLMRLILGAIFIFSTLVLNMILSSFLDPSAAIVWHGFHASFFVTFISTLIMPVFFELTQKWFPQETNSLKQYELFG